MIKSFKDRETEKVFNQEFSKKLPIDIQQKALMRLLTINGGSDYEEVGIENYH